MALFKRKNHLETGLTQLNNLLHHSFKNVQKDTAYILQWLSYFHHKNQHQEQQIKQLQEQLDYMPKSKAEIRKIVDDYYSYEPLLSRIKDLHERIDELGKSHRELHKSHNELHQEITPKIEALKTQITRPETQLQIPTADIDKLHQRLEKLEAKKATIKEKIIKRITKNSKDYIKSIVISYIKKYNQITALQLKEMVVEEQGLCSKSSFYRLLEEIEEDPDIGVIKKGKEKHYIAKITKRN